jgi:hypothetical protein
MLAENEESPSRKLQSNLDSIIASPPIPSTPATGGRIRPSRDEMHPSKVQQSTKKEDQGISLGFSDIGTRRPEPLTTPSKISMPASSEFDFRFARPGPSLGPEAQQMMAEIREEAQRIKAELAAKKEEERLKNGDDNLGMLTGRKFAQPKGKASRYSDVHMAEFKKMDSIAGHPSAFRAQPGRFTPVTKTLKRTQSKANLGDRDGNAPKSTIKPISQSSRLENEAPAKRLRQIGAQDASFARPSSRDGTSQIPSKPSTPTVPRSANFLDSITTPTQASLARTASAKQPGTPFPSMSRSPSKIALTPGLVKSATMNNVAGLARSESTHKFADKMKSILRRPVASPEKPASKLPSSISSLIKSPSRPNLNKELPSAPTTPGASQLPRSKSVKHVNFTPKTIMKDVTQQSPTPLKSGIPRSKSFANLNSVAYPTLPSPSKPIEKNTEKAPQVEKSTVSTIAYPTLPKARELPPTPARQPLKVQPEPVPGVFTFTSGQQIKFGTPPHGFGSSPGQSSIRKVRQSIFSSKMPGSFPQGNNKENKAPAVPHGLTNKKRVRATSPDDDDVDEDQERSPKKRKGAAVAEGQMLMAPKLLAEKMAPKSKIPSPAKKGGLSLSRLKQLATPKKRK